PGIYPARLTLKQALAYLIRVPAVRGRGRPDSIRASLSNRLEKLMRSLFSLFVLFPLVELILLILLGSAIGAGPLILWVLLTAVLGVVLMRRAGWQAWRQADWRMRRGESPARELTDGA